MRLLDKNTFDSCGATSGKFAPVGQLYFDKLAFKRGFPEMSRNMRKKMTKKRTLVELEHRAFPFHS